MCQIVKRNINLLLRPEVYHGQCCRVRASTDAQSLYALRQYGMLLCKRMHDTEKEECEEKREYREPAINHYTLTINH